VCRVVSFGHLTFDVIPDLFVNLTIRSPKEKAFAKQNLWLLSVSYMKCIHLPLDKQGESLKDSIRCHYSLVAPAISSGATLEISTEYSRRLEQYLPE
jgi:hypothetical protein